MFVSYLRPASGRGVIQGNEVRTENPDIQRGGNIATAEAIAKARKANASMVIVGKVSSHQTGGMLNGFVTVRVIDTKSGAIIASIHRPSGLLIANSEHQCVMAAAKKVAVVLSPLL